jgi:wyosine [tRNA(Phe)-imidazoG37] synthetase (radical SAM superfamily)
MQVFLFHDIIFGPVRSRRLGLSLGINLLPTHSKYCSFNCIYCECGWTQKIPGDPVDLPSRTQVREFLEMKLRDLVSEDYLPDALTFAGNGEPTLHPEFAGIVEDTILLRNKYSQGSKVAVLSNASTIGRPEIFNALLRLDRNIQKLDCSHDQLFRIINNPADPVKLSDTVENLRKFNGRLIIQSMFIKGTFRDTVVDNTIEEEVREWLRQIGYIRPGSVMIYSIDRATPSHHLKKVSAEELEKIAKQVRELGIAAEIY